MRALSIADVRGLLLEVQQRAIKRALDFQRIRMFHSALEWRKSSFPDAEFPATAPEVARLIVRTILLEWENLVAQPLTIEVATTRVVRAMLASCRTHVVVDRVPTLTEGIERLFSMEETVLLALPSKVDITEYASAFIIFKIACISHEYFRTHCRFAFSAWASHRRT